MLFLFWRLWSSSRRAVHDRSCVLAGVDGRRCASPVLQHHHCPMNSSVYVVLVMAGSQRSSLTQTYGCHCSIQKRNNLRNALKLDFASFSSFVCRNRRGKPFLSLSLLFKKHVPPSLSLLLCAVQPSALVWLTAACHGSGTSHLPIVPAPCTNTLSARPWSRPQLCLGSSAACAGILI